MKNRLTFFVPEFYSRFDKYIMQHCVQSENVSLALCKQGHRAGVWRSRGDVCTPCV